MTNGIILFGLDNRNAAEFSRLEVPGSYNKALGALTAGSYINVYKWQYQGFALSTSVCVPTQGDGYIILTDKMNGGEMFIYPDDTITIDLGPAGPGFNGIRVRIRMKDYGSYPEPGLTVSFARVVDGYLEDERDEYYGFSLYPYSGFGVDSKYSMTLDWGHLAGSFSNLDGNDTIFSFWKTGSDTWYYCEYVEEGTPSIYALPGSTSVEKPSYDVNTASPKDILIWK